MKVHVKGHYIRRNRKKIWVRPHSRRAVGSKDMGRSGEKFKSLERKIYRYYRKKGYSKSKSIEIAQKTAGKVFWNRYEKKSGSWILKRER